MTAQDDFIRGRIDAAKSAIRGTSCDDEGHSKVVGCLEVICDAEQLSLSEHGVTQAKIDGLAKTLADHRACGNGCGPSNGRSREFRLGNKVLLKNYDPMDVARAVAFVLIILLAIERYAPKLINALSPKATSAAVATERVADK